SWLRDSWQQFIARIEHAHKQHRLGGFAQEHHAPVPKRGDIIALREAAQEPFLVIPPVQRLRWLRWLRCGLRLWWLCRHDGGSPSSVCRRLSSSGTVSTSSRRGVQPARRQTTTDRHYSSLPCCRWMSPLRSSCLSNSLAASLPIPNFSPTLRLEVAPPFQAASARSNWVGSRLRSTVGAGDSSRTSVEGVACSSWSS